MGGRILSLVLCGGCAQLAGIDKTSSPPPPDDLSLQFQRMSVGASIEIAPLDIAGLTATYLVPDASDPTLLDRVDAPATAVDTWTAPISEGTPPVEFELPDFPTPVTRIWELPNPNLVGVFGVLEHPDPQPAPANAMITLAVTLDALAAMGDAYQVYTIGSWTQRPLSAAEVPVASPAISLSYPFASATSITTRPLEALTLADAELVLRYTGAQLTGAFEAPPFAQTGADTITGTLAAVTADQTLDITVDQTTAATRFATPMPALDAPTFNWAVVAAPGYAIANGTGPQLTAGGLAITDPGTITEPFGNPFVPAHDWRSMFVWSTGATRTFTPTGQMLVATLSAGLYQVLEPAPALTLDLPAGLPQIITLAGTPLVLDGASVIIDPLHAVTVSFTNDQASNTLYQLQLFELLPDAAGTALVQNLRFGATGTQASFILPPEQFIAGHTYSLRAICISGGYPAIAAGDLSQRQLPVAVGYFDSGVFTVAAM